MTERDVAEMRKAYPAATTVEWLVLDTVGTVYGPIRDEASARKLAAPIRRRLFRRTVRRTGWDEVATTFPPPNLSTTEGDD